MATKQHVSRFAVARDWLVALLSVGAVAVLLAAAGAASIAAGVALLFGPGWSLVVAGTQLVAVGWLLLRGMNRA